jgi:hypothetical protein
MQYNTLYLSGKRTDFFMTFYIAQAVGFVGMTLAFISFQQNKRERIAFLQMLSSLFWILHFGMLGAYSGMAMNAIGAARGYVYSKKGSASWSSREFWPYVFSVVSAGSCVATWENWLSLLPAVATVVTSFGLWVDEPKTVRRLTLPGSWMWLAYNLVNVSWAGVITECFSTASIFIAMWRFDRKGRKNS